jgi:hypothetical protein
VDAGLVCPGSIADNGKACSVEGQSCPTGYPCGAFAQQATCVCTNGVFACTDATGAVVDPNGGTPACKPQTANNPNCPTAEADSTKCTDTGLQCFYAGVTCPGATAPSQDVCQCVANPSSTSNPAGLVWKCEPATCNPSADSGLDAPATPDSADTSPPGHDASDSSTAPADAAEGG